MVKAGDGWREDQSEGMKKDRRSGLDYNYPFISVVSFYRLTAVFISDGKDDIFKAFLYNLPVDLLAIGWIK